MPASPAPGSRRSPQNLDQLKQQATSTNEQDVVLRAFEREAKAQRDLLESYLAKYREASARDLLGVMPAEARIISRAIVSNTPAFPKKLPIVLIATFATLFLSAGFITTGELLAGNVYRPAYVAADEVTLVPAIVDVPVEETSAPVEAPPIVTEPTVHLRPSLWSRADPRIAARAAIAELVQALRERTEYRAVAVGGR